MPSSRRSTSPGVNGFSVNVAAAILCAASLTLFACDDEPKPNVPAGSDAAPLPAVSSSAGNRAARSRPHPRNEPRQPFACRALRVIGSVGVKAPPNAAPASQANPGSTSPRRKPLKVGQALDGETWLELEAQSRVVIRHANSAREYSLVGPASVLPCYQGNEIVILEHGLFEAKAGTGIRPGALVWVATPHAVTSYADAQLAVQSADRFSEIRVEGGGARVREGQHTERFSSGPPGDERIRVTSKPAWSSESSVVACEAAAKAASAGALRITKPVASNAPETSLGQLAADHLRLRRSARAACLGAIAAVARESDTKAQQRFRERVMKSMRKWQAIPAP